MPASNPFIAGVPFLVPNQAPASTAPFHPDGGGGMNPYQGTVNDTNAAGSQEAIGMHVAAIIALALVGVFVFRALGFSFVGAAKIGVG